MQWVRRVRDRIRPTARGRGSRCAMVLMLALAAGCSRPDVYFVDGEGARWRDWDGKWLVINYWAEWCAPCRVEIPELNHLHRDGGAAGVVVLGVNFDGVTGPGMDRLIELFDIQFPVLLEDPGARWAQPKPAVLPTTLIIDPAGELLQVLVGPQTFESLAASVGLEAAE